jgi:hypothetical protein
MAGDKRRINLTKFERNDQPLFRVYSGQDKDSIEINFNDSAIKQLKIKEGDELYMSPSKGIFVVVPEGDEVDQENSRDYRIVQSTPPNIFFRSKSIPDLPRGLYQLFVDMKNVNNRKWHGFEKIEELPSRKNWNVKAEISRSEKDKIFNFYVRKYKSKGRDYWTILFKQKDGEKLNIVENDYLIFDPENNLMGVVKQNMEKNSVNYKAYVIKANGDLFQVSSVHRKVFERAGVYDLTTKTTVKDQQKFHKFGLNQKKSNDERTLQRSHQGDSELLQNRSIERDSFKYDKRSLIKVYEVKNKKQTQHVLLVNTKTIAELDLTADYYFSFKDDDDVIGFSKSKDSFDEDAKVYKLADQQKMLSARFSPKSFSKLGVGVFELDTEATTETDDILWVTVKEKSEKQIEEEEPVDENYILNFDTFSRKIY